MTEQMLALGRTEVWIAIAVMTAVTVFSRLGGYWLMAYVPVTPRVRRMLDALPGAIIISAITPVVLNGGPVVILAIAAAIGVTLIKRNDFIAVMTGMGVAALARFAGFSG